MLTQKTKDKYLQFNDLLLKFDDKSIKANYIYPSHTYKNQNKTNSFKILLNDDRDFDTNIKIHTTELIAIHSGVDIVKAYYKGYYFLGWGDFKPLKFSQQLSKDRKSNNNSVFISENTLGQLRWGRIWN